MRTTMRMGLRATGNPCDEWWDSLSTGQKGALWILMRMTGELKMGGTIELRRGRDGITANVMDESKLQEAQLN